MDDPFISKQKYLLMLESLFSSLYCKTPAFIKWRYGDSPFEIFWMKKVGWKKKRKFWSGKKLALKFVTLPLDYCVNLATCKKEKLVPDSFAPIW